MVPSQIQRVREIHLKSLTDTLSIHGCEGWIALIRFHGGEYVFFLIRQSFFLILFLDELEYPVLCLMARNYLAIPATTCIAEHSFSLSARTDNPQRRQMQKAKFGGLQKLWAGYMDGRLNVAGKIMEKYIGDFDFCEDFRDEVAEVAN